MNFFFLENNLPKQEWKVCFTSVLIFMYTWDISVWRSCIWASVKWWFMVLVILVSRSHQIFLYIKSQRSILCKQGHLNCFFSSTWLYFLVFRTTYYSFRSYISLTGTYKGLQFHIWSFLYYVMKSNMESFIM